LFPDVRKIRLHLFPSKGWQETCSSERNIKRGKIPGFLSRVGTEFGKAFDLLFGFGSAD